MNIELQKKGLVEMLGVHFENLYNLPPLGSRIFGILVVDGYGKGITFEELVERTHASKSSVSTGLNLLLKMQKITYYTISGDRKKYFKPAPFSNRLEGYLNIIDLEKQILIELISYREQTCKTPPEKINIAHVKAYQSHIIEIEKVLQNTISKFKGIEETNKNKA